jgi:hypothetical protein
MGRNQGFVNFVAFVVQFWSARVLLDPSHGSG